MRSRKDVDALYKLAQMKTNPNTPLGIATGLRIKNRGGYLGKLNRQVKKTGSQLKGLPGCGQQVRDWLTGWE